jgi:CBS domain-containing protein
VLSDKVTTLKLPAPLTVGANTSVREVIRKVQAERAGAVLVTEGNELLGIMTERDVLMKVLARDVSYDDPVERFMTAQPRTLEADATIGDVITLMMDEGFRNVPITDTKTGGAIGLCRVRDVVGHLAESFPEHVLNLPPRPHQTMETPEGA